MNAKTFLAVTFIGSSLYVPLKADNFDLSRAYLNYNFGQYISIVNSYAELELFMPTFGCEKNMIALDGTAYKFDDGRWASSAGIVLRKCIGEKHAVGFNTYYDYLRGPCHSNFNRIGVGFEWLSKNFDVRLNGYLPTWKQNQKCDTCVFDDIGSGYYATETKVVSAYHGLNAEVGRNLWKKHNWGIYAAVGPYYFQQSCLYTFWGGSIRVEANWNRYVYMKVRASFDPAYHANVQGIIGVSIPLDFSFKKRSEPNLCRNNLRKKIERIGIILTESYCDWTWNWNDN